MNRADVEDEVRALEGLDLEGLRRIWIKRLGPAPKLRSLRLLQLHLAWRMQTYVDGGIDGPLRRALKSQGTIEPPLAGLRPGARLARDWRGIRHEVEVIEEGFLHQGVTYRSLSQAARAITGSRWNGPRFFGLREKGQGT